ncbi:MAG: nucleotide exchange factor GrpE [Verrucomicrobia bacterium]|nr:nucleotide exchange factor GrpE [Verrucomicrobiota bacterium]
MTFDPEQEVEEKMAEETPSESQEQPAAPPEEDWKTKYFRALAEQENMRKRMQKEKQDVLRYCYESCIGEFLPPLDNLENALRFTDQATGEVKNWAMGFQMILAQFKEVLHNHGIVAFHSEGNTFDPHYHEAVEIVETEEHPDGAILKEFTKGYKSAARTVRPARVKVAKRPKKVEPAEPKTEESVEELNKKEE